MTRGEAGIDFVKMVGTGNDFIVVDDRSGRIGRKARECARRWCERKRSIGADGLLVLERSKKAAFRMRIYNPDGTEAEMCGNGIRCIAKFAAERRIARGRFQIETLAGLIEATILGDVVKARLVDPSDLRLGFLLDLSGRRRITHFINTGVPHAVVLEKSIREVNVDALGREIRRHREFAPAGANANFVAIKPGNRIEVRTYERGVEGETLSCGTGSTASALVAAAVKGLRSPVVVHTESGDTLRVYFTRTASGEFHDVYLEGRVRKIFEGRVA